MAGKTNNNNKNADNHRLIILYEFLLDCVVCVCVFVFIMYLSTNLVCDQIYF